MRSSRTPGAGVAAPTEWITGDARIHAVVDPEPRVGMGGVRIDRVRFAPGARIVWHRHPLGQILIGTEGAGLVQHRGGPVETIRVGDTVRIAAGEWHWHGATPTTAMTHLAIEEIPDDGTAPEPGAWPNTSKPITPYRTLRP